MTTLIGLSLEWTALPIRETYKPINLLHLWDELQKFVWEKYSSGGVFVWNIISQRNISALFPDEYSPDNHKNSKTFVQCLCWWCWPKEGGRRGFIQKTRNWFIYLLLYLVHYVRNIATNNISYFIKVCMVLILEV